MFFRDIPVKFQSDLFQVKLYQIYHKPIHSFLEYTEEMMESQNLHQMYKTKPIGNDFNFP